MPEGLAVGLVGAYGYLVGSIPTAYLVGRWAKKLDLRQLGSGNVGGSNVAVHIGKAYFIPVVIVDILVKGTTPVLLARVLDLGLGYQALVGLLAVAGHNWSLYFHFVGGRGVGTGAGVLLALAPEEFVAAVAVAGLGWLLFRSTALWVGIAYVLLPLWATVRGEPLEVILFCLALVVLLAMKRLDANRLKAPEGVPWHLLALRRLAFDRDVSTKEEWTQRSSGEVE